MPDFKTTISAAAQAPTIFPLPPMNLSTPVLALRTILKRGCLTPDELIIASELSASIDGTGLLILFFALALAYTSLNFTRGI
jgi:hypothetical protein